MGDMGEMTTRRELVERAIAIAGTEKRLGEQCGCSQNKIWLAKIGGPLTAELAMMIEAATGGEVLARDLRPDLPWPSPNSDAPQATGAPA